MTDSQFSASPMRAATILFRVLISARPFLVRASSSSPTIMSPVEVPLHAPALVPNANVCFACKPLPKHERVWKPDPNTPDRHRTLVVCFDGTGDSFDQDVSPFLSRIWFHAHRPILQNSNVVQFLSMLKKDDPAKQLVYYQVISFALHQILTISLYRFSPGRHRHLYRQRCSRHADYPGHVQIIGPNDCLEPP